MQLVDPKLISGAARGFGKEYAVRAAAFGCDGFPHLSRRPSASSENADHKLPRDMCSAKLVIGDLSQADIDLVVSEIEAAGG